MNRIKPPITAICILITFFILLSGCKKEEVPPPETKHYKQAVGKSAGDLLKDETYTRLVVEMQYVDGFAPEQASLDNMKAFLESLIHKPGGITIEMKAIPSPGLASYAIDEVKDIEDAHRTRFTMDSTLAIYFFFADGNSSEDQGNSVILGAAYRNTSMVIYEKTIRDMSGGLTQPSREKLETTVINHELGHILGLVNTGSTMQNDHQDHAHGHHCDDTQCLMYYQAETGDIVANLIGQSVPELDAQCLADLKANGGK